MPVIGGVLITTATSTVDPSGRGGLRDLLPFAAQ